MLKIQIHNVGKIKKAQIELDGITVIAGMNGTGKSTIAKSVFASVNARKNITDKIRQDRRLDIEDKLAQWLEHNNDFENAVFFDDYEELAGHILEAYEHEKWNEPDIYDETEQIIEEYCSNNKLNDNDIEEITEKITNILNRNLDDYIQFFVEQYYQNVFKNQINTIGTRRKASVSYKKMEAGKTVASSVSIQKNKLTIVGKPLVLQQENAIYIETHNVLDFCEEIGKGSRRSLRANKITLPTRELLNSLTTEKELTFVQQQQIEVNEKIVHDIVEQITHGHLRKNQSGIMEFLDDEANEKIEFSNLSAGLKIFTVLQQLIGNYSLRKGDILIVDEPEVNLHPTWQIVLAEILVRVYKELGIYILINSHSPYFIRAIEVKMAEYQCARKARYYFMEQEADSFVSTDVSEHTNVIYDALYQPLSLL